VAKKKPVELAPFDQLFDQALEISKKAIDAWAGTAKELVGNEPFGTLTEGLAGIFTAYFDWAKLLQEIPPFQGGGLPKTSMLAENQNLTAPKAAAGPVTTSLEVQGTVAGPLYTSAFVNGAGEKFAGQIAATAAQTPSKPNSTTITLTLTPKSTDLAGDYGGSILDSSYHLLAGPLHVTVS
jgi:hypothetical protein